jgi:hypothetical protein
MISVLCKSDSHLHLARESQQYSRSVSVFTLCLRRWSKREPARTDSQFCPECLALWKQEEHSHDGD